MKPESSSLKLAHALTLSTLLLAPQIGDAQGWKLVGITGQQDNADTFNFPDHTIFDLDTFLTDPGFGVSDKLFTATFVNDSQSIGFCPADGLLYHTAGSESYSNNPLRQGHDQGGPTIFGVGYQDSQYMETIDLQTRTFTGVYNAAPCPNPDPSLPCFGIAAPRPSWVLPVERRNSTQTGGEYRARGSNEYHAVRGLAWSASKSAFYAADEFGIFKITPAGDCTFVARPAFPSDSQVDESKSILVVPERLLIGHRNAGFLMEVEAETGRVLRSITLNYPPGGGAPVNEFGGVLGLAQHPVTKVIYAIRQTDNNFARELVTVDVRTGDTVLVGDTKLHIASIAFVSTGNTNAPWQLVGISGQQDNADAFTYPDHTIFDLDTFLTDPGFGSSVKLFTATFVNDSQSIGFCPADGLLYHTGGSESYSNNPQRQGHDQGGPPIFGVGYQDSQYMETIDMATQTFRGIYNADPCPNPDPSLPCFGLAAPRPSWVLPVERRNSTQTGGEYRARGSNEYHAVRGLAWSASKNAFYAADEFGIFRITRDGDCKFIARPAFPSDNAVDESKSILVIPETLLVGHRNAGFIMEVDAETGAVVRDVALKYPTGGGAPLDAFGGVLGLAQHPETRTIYGIRQTDNNFARELVTIDTQTGDTALVGDTKLHIASIAFAEIPPLKIRSISRFGTSVRINWAGGNPPYQLQSRVDLGSGTWGDVGGPTTEFSATVPATGNHQFFRVIGQ
jgi:hypothetical protein